MIQPFHYKKYKLYFSECENGTLQISAERTLSGNYTCSAGNLAGTGEVSTQALVMIYCKCILLFTYLPNIHL